MVPMMTDGALNYFNLKKNTKKYKSNLFLNLLIYFYV